MPSITKLLPDATNVGNLGKLPVKGRPNVNYIPSGGGEGSLCFKNGKKGKIRWVNGKATCVTNSSQESEEMDTDLKEALKDVKEAKALRFSSPSRTQIGKQYHHSVDYMTAVQGLGKLKASQIDGGPGNWFFTLSANEDNQNLDTSRMNGKIYAGVTVQAVARESVETPKSGENLSVSEAIKKMVEEAKAKLEG